MAYDEEYFKAAMESLMIHYPEVEINQDAKVKLELYNLSKPMICIYVNLKGNSKRKYEYSKEFEPVVSVLDYDKDGGVVGIELIFDGELGDLKE